MPSYEPEVIERFAAQLERRARAVRRGFTASGLILGAGFGSFPLTSFGSAWPIPHIFGFATLLVGAGIGALIGWVVGEGRAAMYRLHAQTTLCQLHAQRTTLAIWRLLQEQRPDSQSVRDISRDLESDVETESKVEVDRESEVNKPTPEPVLAPAPRLPARPAPRIVPAEAEAALVAEPAPILEPVHVRPPAASPLLPPLAPTPTPSHAFASAPSFAPISPPALAPALESEPEPLLSLSAPAASPPPAAPEAAPPPLSAPATAPAPISPPAHEPLPTYAGRSAPSALRPLDAPALPVEPPPLSS